MVKKVHCLFEQSGTFKEEFKKLGVDAEDYDILNQFNETDNVVDLFHEIEVAYEGGNRYSMASKKGKSQWLSSHAPNSKSRKPCSTAEMHSNKKNIQMRENWKIVFITIKLFIGITN